MHDYSQAGQDEWVLTTIKHHFGMQPYFVDTNKIAIFTVAYRFHYVSNHF